SGLLSRVFHSLQRGIAESVLAEHPDWPADRAAQVQCAFEEYLDRDEAGEAVDISAFCARYPAIKTSLRLHLQGYQLAEANAQHLPGSTDVRDLAPSPPLPWPKSGASFLDFTLVRELGRGAFARVFLARETRLGDRPV